MKISHKKFKQVKHINTYKAWLMPIFIALAAAIMTVGCGINGQQYEEEKSIADNSKEIIEDTRNNQSENEYNKKEKQIKPVLDTNTQKKKDLEEKFINSRWFIGDRMIPLAIIKDYSSFITYRLMNEGLQSVNETILIGMPRQMVELFKVDLSSGEVKKLGNSEFIISSGWSDNGRLLYIVSYKNVKIIDVKTDKIIEIPLKNSTEHLYNANWYQDNSKLVIHNDITANYYVYDYDTGKVVKRRGQFDDGEKVYRGEIDGKSLISIARVGAAGGLYTQDGRTLFDNDVIIHDKNGSRILVSHENRNKTSYREYVLEDLDIATGKIKQIFKGNSLYKASYLKHSDEIIYTTFEVDDIEIKYLLNFVTNRGEIVTKHVPSPLYNVTPGESKIHFATFVNGKGCIMDTSEKEFEVEIPKSLYTNEGIRNTMLKALKVYSSETPDESKIKEIFINSYDPIPQEALENILLEVGKPHLWRFMRSDIRKDIRFTVEMWDKGTRASVTFANTYFRGPHELIKVNERWYITGFSTWPNRSERNSVQLECEKWIKKVDSARQQRDIPNKQNRDDEENMVVNILKETGYDYKSISVGEIEFWAMSDPHRAIPDYGYATEARVKIIVDYENDSTRKYHMHLSRKDTGSRWVLKSIGELSPGLWPK